MNMKKILAFSAAAIMAVTALAGCGKGNTTSGTDSKVEDSKAEVKEESGDLAYIKDKGTMTIGYTIMEPLNYTDESGKFTGFETEFAEAVCEKLGVKAEFQLIDWDSKEVELNGKTIDCIWNGLTITDERKANMSITDPYLANRQALVVKKENVDKYTASLDGASVVVEAGSAGDDLANSDEHFKGAEVTAVDAQATALMDVKSGTSDVAVIDYVMSGGSVRPGSSYEDLAIIDLNFPAEEYGVAFRKGSNVTAEVNKAMDEMRADGSLEALADKYGLKNILIND